MVARIGKISMIYKIRYLLLLLLFIDICTYFLFTFSNRRLLVFILCVSVGTMRFEYYILFSIAIVKK